MGNISQYDLGEQRGPKVSCFAIFAAIGLKFGLMFCSKEVQVAFWCG
jgi:hypothetical protein